MNGRVDGREKCRRLEFVRVVLALYLAAPFRLRRNQSDAHAARIGVDEARAFVMNP